MMDDEHGALVEDKDIPYSVQLQLIKKRTERGMSPVQIARLMGLKKVAVQRIVAEHGWKPRRKVEPEPKKRQKTQVQLERERLADIARILAQRGKTRQETADIIGKSLDYVHGLAVQYNIKFQRSKLTKLQKYRSLFFYNDSKQLEAKGFTEKQMAIELKTSEQTVRDCFEFFEKGAKP